MRTVSGYHIVLCYCGVAIATDKEGYQKEIQDIKELMPDLDSKVSCLGWKFLFYLNVCVHLLYYCV